MIKHLRTATTAVSAAVAVPVLLWATPAQAAIHSVETFGFSTPAHPYFSGACGFPVAFALQGSFNIVEFRTDDGDLVKEIRNYRATAEISANGITLRGWLRGPEITESDADGGYTVSQIGVVGRKSGDGVFLQQVGRYVTHFAADGTETEVAASGEREDIAELCQALAPA